MSFEKYFKQWDVDLYEQTETQTEDVELLQRLIGNRRGLHIFEVACGTGRILLPLAKDGHTMTGMDMDNRMIAKLFEKADGLTNVTIIQNDAVESDWGQGYDIVILAGNILLNIVSAQNPIAAEKAFVQKAYAALKQGGYLFMDNNGFMHPERFFNQSGVRVIFDGADNAGVFGRYMLVDSTWDASTQSVSGTRRWELTTPNGESFTKEEPYTKIIPSVKNMDEWLAEANFIIEHRFGDYNGRPIGEDTYRAVYWARKPG